MSDIILPIQLTTGWPIAYTDSLTAKALHQAAQARASSEPDYQEELKKLLNQNQSDDIVNFDQLLRRHANGFVDINTFTAALLNIWEELSEPKSCSIDIFAYAFLKHAKNYDLFMKPERDSITQLENIIIDWQNAVAALENMERLGQELSPEYSHLKQVYLRLRAVVSRPSARDEQRTLAILLITGPLTIDEISEDLGLNYSLNLRIISALQATGAIDSRDDKGKARYFITESALPVALFLVREIIGLDLLSMVVNLKESS